MPLPPKSRYQLHVEKWRNGCGSELCDRATNRVFARGKIPCDVLFVGEAPGDSEDVLGKPFCGPAGHHMEEIIKAAWEMAGVSYSHCFYNLLGCIPHDENGRKPERLDHDDVMSCQPRLKEFLTMARPRLVVCLGRDPKDYFDQTYKYAVKLPAGVGKLELIHPAALLRMNVVQKGLRTQEAVVELATALDELRGRGEGRC